MARIFSKPGDPAPSIDAAEVLDFFEQRAAKAGTLGPTRAVIYQDKHADLAERRDAAEKALLLPKMAIGPQDRVADVGCGTGRWAEALIPLCAYYHGCDVSPGLIEIAQRRYSQWSNRAAFSVVPADGVSLETLGEDRPFNRLIAFGVFMYMNDAEASVAMRGISAIAHPKARFVLREPIGVSERLTIKEHFSADMEQTYNAIYRTEAELMELAHPLFESGFECVEQGDVYADQALNNRAETRQRWYVFAR